MKKIVKNIIIFLSISVILGLDARPISLRPFDTNSSGMVYGRGTYMIVLPNQSIESYIIDENYAGDFVKFKKTQGFDVEVVFYDQIATNAQELKDYIMNYYENNPMLEYVLLVGDVNGPYAIPTFTINSYNEEDVDVTDYPYTFSDNSYDAKFFLGRWPVRNVVDLLNIKSRSIQYIKNDYIDDEIYNNALLVAGNYKTAEGSEVPPNEWPVTPVWTSLWLMDELYDYGYAQVDTAFFHAGNYETGEFNPLIENVWNQGIGVINYRGWGDANGWHKPYFHRENVDVLNNGWKLPIVMSFVCNTGDFGNDYSGTGLAKCFGEVLVTAGSIANPRGATAVVGPSDLDTDTRFNNVICGVMWDALLDGTATELAPALHYGKQSLTYEFSGLSAPDGTVIDEFYHHVYGVLGDPSLPVTLEQPSNIIYDDISELHQSYIEMSLTDEDGSPLNMVVGALLDNDDNLIGKGISDVDGILLINFESSAFGSEFTLYLNKAQFKQEQISINYIEDDGSQINQSLSLQLDSYFDFSVQQFAFPLYLVPGVSLDFDIVYSNISEYDINSLSVELNVVDDSNQSFVLTQAVNSIDINAFGESSVELSITTPNDIEIGTKVNISTTFSHDDFIISTNDVELIVSEDWLEYYSSSPTPACDYGYWAYDSTDDSESNPVVYDWIEINDIGTNLNLQDDTIYNDLQLPFTFKYFGIEYDAINVCSNGWVSFVPTQLDYFWNFSIPNPLGPSAMIAPFMDDLDDNNGTEPFNIYSYSDNEKFIVQWDDVSNGEDDQNCPNCIKETFQLILYNNGDGTATGDGEIQFQYKEVYDIDANGNYSTIGIESHGQDDGTQYLFSKNLALGALWPEDDNGMVSNFAIKFTTNSPNFSGNQQECQLYDISLDGSINVVDIVNLVNIIFGLTTPTQEQECAADTNGDGVINVVDVVTLVNYILNS